MGAGLSWFGFGRSLVAGAWVGRGWSLGVCTEALPPNNPIGELSGAERFAKKALWRWSALAHAPWPSVPLGALPLGSGAWAEAWAWVWVVSGRVVAVMGSMCLW